jgi:hypothetical protein
MRVGGSVVALALMPQHVFCVQRRDDFGVDLSTRSRIRRVQCERWMIRGHNQLSGMLDRFAAGILQARASRWVPPLARWRPMQRSREPQPPGSPLEPVLACFDLALRWRFMHAALAARRPFEMFDCSFVR